MSKRKTKSSQQLRVTCFSDGGDLSGGAAALEDAIAIDAVEVDGVRLLELW